MEVITELDMRIMSEISKDLTRKWSIRGISLAIGKHYRPVYQAVQRLLKWGHIARNANRLLEPLFKEALLLEIAERNRLSTQRKEIRIIENRLKNMRSVFFSAVLFGSSVNKKGRDIDILMIIPDSESIEKFKQEAKTALGSFESEVDIQAIHEESCYEMLNNPNQLNVMNEIMKNHLVLNGAESFYNILKRWKNG